MDMKRVKDGFSNNPNYVGDWYGKGQIDYSAIINPNADGDVYMVKIWCGSGYTLDVYLVKASDEQNAINQVFKWSYENEGANNVVYDRDYLQNLIEQDYNDEYFYGRDGGKPSDKYDLEEFEEIWLEDYVFDDNYWLFAYAENFFVGLVPDEYLNEPVSDSRRVKDSDDDNDDYVEGENEYIVTVAVVGSESMTNEEAEQYEDELKDALKQRYEWDGYFEVDLVETMDRVGVGESVAVWAWCYADSQETVYNAVNIFTSKFDYDVRINVRPAID